MLSETTTATTIMASSGTACPAVLAATAAVPPTVNYDANSEATSVPHAAANTNTDSPDGNADALQCTTVNLAAVTGAPPHQMDKCAVRGCPKFPNPPCLMDICSFVSCPKFVHPQCYANIICKSLGRKTARIAFEEISFCTASHHDMYAKALSEDNLNLTIDGTLGCKDPLTSQHYLITWLSTGNNYNRSPSGGRT